MEKENTGKKTMIAGYAGIAYNAVLAGSLGDFSKKYLTESNFYTIGYITAFFIMAVLFDLVRCKKQNYMIIQVSFIIALIASTVCYLHFQTKMFGIIMG